MEQTPLSLRRLMNRRTALAALESLAPLLPEVILALVDRDGRVIAQAGAVSREEYTAQTMTFPLQVSGEQVGMLVAQGLGLDRPAIQLALQSLRRNVTELLHRAEENRTLAQETLERYREINLLYNIGETISASLDPDEIPRLVLAEAGRIIRADAGMVLLLDDDGTLAVRSGFGEDILLADLERVSHPLLTLGAPEWGKSRIYTADPSLQPPATIEHVLCAPLKTRDRALGIVLLGRRAGQPVFRAGDEKLLSALTGQTAVAVENARLFADVRQQRDAIAEIKSYMDNIFASIASGVITTNIEDLVTVLNRAAERILGVEAADTMGRSYEDALPLIGPEIAPLVERVKALDTSVVGHEMSPILPHRGQVVLQIHLSPLKDNREQTTGIAIVVDDLTERRRLEEQVRQVRGTFERYVPPRVVEQLLSDPSRVLLGGVRQEVTILFADIRGFTAYSENLDPEALVRVLNQHLTLAADAVLDEDGTLDKFLGDAVMAIFNAPLAQPDHTLRAVRAALAMQESITWLHSNLPPHERLSFGVGIVTGPAIVGNVGSPILQNYTAIGDSVNLASRLQNHASPGQVLLNPTAFELVREQVIAREYGQVQVKGHSELDLVYELIGLQHRG
jgi:PAS domain S-box-containing protein